MSNLKLFFQKSDNQKDYVDSISIEYFNGDIHGHNNLTFDITQDEITISTSNDQLDGFIVKKIPIADLLQLAERKISIGKHWGCHKVQRFEI